VLLGCSTSIKAPTRTVFACVDEPDHIVRWVGGAVEHTYLDERDPATAVGQRFCQRLRQGRTIRTFHGEIIAWEPTNHFGLRIPTPSYTSEAHFRITADGPGRSRVDYSIDVDLHSTIAKIVGALFRVPLRLFVRGQIASLKAYAEALYAGQGARV
jgi:uncharacterized protein YndB with AHSA1/START domain